MGYLVLACIVLNLVCPVCGVSVVILTWPQPSAKHTSVEAIKRGGSTVTGYCWLEIQEESATE